MDKNAALCVYLKKYHTGKEKAVPSTELDMYPVYWTLLLN